MTTVSLPSRFEINARRIKRRIPPSWFTKKGPGVRAGALRAFRLLDPIDRQIAMQKGWFPPAWANLPFKPQPLSVEPIPAPPKPGLLSRMWSGLKRMFGGRS